MRNSQDLWMRREALADKRAARSALLDGDRETAARLARATADSRAADEALARCLADNGVPPTATIPGIYPLAVRHQVEDLLHRAGLASQHLNQVMLEGEGVSAFASFRHNVEQSMDLLRQIAVRRTSELRGKATGKGKR
jgi:hypothetical protein